jgi:hypothetical protein
VPMKKKYVTPSVAPYKLEIEGPLCADSVALTIDRAYIQYEDYEEVAETQDIFLL